MEGWHSAFGDAHTTAEVFLSLIPKLCERNIRTLAEAEAACKEMTEVLEDHHRAGWIEPVHREEAEISERALARVDPYPYRHRIHEVMSSPPITVSPDMTLGEALKFLADHQISSVLASDEEDLRPDNFGILTERDVLRAVAKDGAEALTHKISDYATTPVACVLGDAFLYRAIGRMSRMGIRHLGVQDMSGNIVGMLSSRDLLRLRAMDAFSLGDDIEAANTTNKLGPVWARLPVVANSLLDESVDGRQVAAVISRELCALTRQAAEIAEKRMLADGHGPPPVPYAVFVLGSGGRGESLLAADQDNAIVYTDAAESAEAVDQWFEILGTHVADILNEIGVPYCKGGVMARNREWRASVSEWKERIEDWLRRSRPSDLLNVDIFFDLRAIHGNGALADEIWRHAFEEAHQRPAFAKLLAESSAGFQPPITFFGGLRTEENGRLDLKKGGLFLIVSSARVLAIRHNVQRHATPDRIEGIRALEIGSNEDYDRIIETHRLILDVMLTQQVIDIANGLPPSNKIEVKRLSPAVADRLKRGLSGLSTIDDMVHDLLFAH